MKLCNDTAAFGPPYLIAPDIPNPTKGFSLIELLLVLGVLAILLVAAFVVYPGVRDRNQANTEVSNLTTIKANINNLFSSNGGNYADLTNAVAINANAYPQSMIVASSAPAFGAQDIPAVQSSWGGAVTSTVNGDSDRLFDITYSAVPESVCLGMISGAAGNFTSITVGTDGTNLIEDNGQLDVVGATQDCARTGTAGSPIVFTSN